MNRIRTNIGCAVYFTRWSAKNYAIFASLGKQVCIAVLALHICVAALLKSARKGVMISDACVAEELERGLWEVFFRLRMVLHSCTMGRVCRDGRLYQLESFNIEGYTRRGHILFLM